MSKSLKEQRPYKYPLVLVIWDDAETDSGWEQVPDKLEPCLATSVGFLVRQTQDYILLAMSYDETNTDNRFQIPKSVVKNMKELK